MSTSSTNNIEGTSSTNNNNGRRLYSRIPGKGIVVSDATTFQTTGSLIQPSGSRIRSNSKYFLMEGEREANKIYKDGNLYKQNKSQFTGNKLISDYNNFITKLENMIELEELLLLFAKTINVSYEINSEYDLSQLYNPNFFEEKIKNLNISQVRALKEICKKIISFLTNIQYVYFDINENINGTQQKDIDLFNHVIGLLEEREMNTTSLAHLAKMKEVNTSIQRINP